MKEHAKKTEFSQLVLTMSLSGILMDFPVLKEVSIPFLVIGADGSVPFSSGAIPFGAVTRKK